jgi:hypothetical protein
MKNKAKRAVLVMEEAAGKRIRRLSLEEAYPKSHEIYLTVEFEDETEILIEVGCAPSFGITHLARDARGDLEPIKKPMHGSMRMLLKTKSNAV